MAAAFVIRGIVDYPSTKGGADQKCHRKLVSRRRMSVYSLNVMAWGGDFNRTFLAFVASSVSSPPNGVTLAFPLVSAQPKPLVSVAGSSHKLGWRY